MYGEFFLTGPPAELKVSLSVEYQYTCSKNAHTHKNEHTKKGEKKVHKRCTNRAQRLHKKTNKIVGAHKSERVRAQESESERVIARETTFVTTLVVSPRSPCP